MSCLEIQLCEPEKGVPRLETDIGPSTSMTGLILPAEKPRIHSLPGQEFSLAVVEEIKARTINIK